MVVEATGNADGSLHISQAKYICDLLHKTNMLEVNSCPTPMISSFRLTKDGSFAINVHSLYRFVVGALQYVTITRPELAFSVNCVYQYMYTPQEHHWKTVKCILRYLTGTISVRILHRPTKRLHPTKRLLLHGFNDSDWGNDIDDRKSTTRFCVYLGSNVVSWSSHKQKVVSRSTIS